MIKISRFALEHHVHVTKIPNSTRSIVRAGDQDTMLEVKCKFVHHIRVSSEYCSWCSSLAVQMPHTNRFVLWSWRHESILLIDHNIHDNVLVSSTSISKLPCTCVLERKVFRKCSRTSDRVIRRIFGNYRVSEWGDTVIRVVLRGIWSKFSFNHVREDQTFTK